MRVHLVLPFGRLRLGGRGCKWMVVQEDQSCARHNPERTYEPFAAAEPFEDRAAATPLAPGPTPLQSWSLLDLFYGLEVIHERLMQNADCWLLGGGGDIAVRVMDERAGLHHERERIEEELRLRWRARWGVVPTGREDSSSV